MTEASRKYIIFLKRVSTIIISTSSTKVALVPPKDRITNLFTFYCWKTSNWVSFFFLSRENFSLIIHTHIYIYTEKRFMQNQTSNAVARITPGNFHPQFSSLYTSILGEKPLYIFQFQVERYTFSKFQKWKRLDSILIWIDISRTNCLWRTRTRRRTRRSRKSREGFLNSTRVYIPSHPVSRLLLMFCRVVVTRQV